MGVTLEADMHFMQYHTPEFLQRNVQNPHGCVHQIQSSSENRRQKIIVPLRATCLQMATVKLMDIRP